jgi:hypothetical protein
MNSHHGAAAAAASTELKHHALTKIPLLQRVLLFSHGHSVGRVLELAQVHSAWHETIIAFPVWRCCFSLHSSSASVRMKLRDLLWRAADLNAVDIVKSLLRDGLSAARDQSTVHGWPLFAAIRRGHIETVALLLHCGADEDAQQQQLKQQRQREKDDDDEEEDNSGDDSEGGSFLDSMVDIREQSALHQCAHSTPVQEAVRMMSLLLQFCNPRLAFEADFEGALPLTYAVTRSLELSKVLLAAMRKVAPRYDPLAFPADEDGVPITTFSTAARRFALWNEAASPQRPFHRVCSAAGRVDALETAKWLMAESRDKWWSLDSLDVAGNCDALDGADASAVAVENSAASRVMALVRYIVRELADPAPKWAIERHPLASHDPAGFAVNGDTVYGWDAATRRTTVVTRDAKLHFLESAITKSNAYRRWLARLDDERHPPRRSSFEPTPPPPPPVNLRECPVVVEFCREAHRRKVRLFDEDVIAAVKEVVGGAAK